MNSLNPKSDSYEQGQKIIASLLIMLDKEDFMQSRIDPDHVPKEKMTYEEFLDDPFGRKKFVLEDFYAA